METLLKKPEPFRDSMGRFDRHGKALSKTAKNKMNKKQLANTGQFQSGVDARRAPGRPKGSPNKTTRALKEMILASLHELGGKEYLKALGVQNSSAYTSLLKAVYPTTLATENDGGVGVEIRFTRHIVYPSGRTEIVGVTPKALPAPDAAITDTGDVNATCTQNEE
jgi:hypothetical protein